MFVVKKTLSPETIEHLKQYVTVLQYMFRFDEEYRKDDFHITIAYDKSGRPVTDTDLDQTEFVIKKSDIIGLDIFPYEGRNVLVLRLDFHALHLRHAELVRKFDFLHEFKDNVRFHITLCRDLQETMNPIRFEEVKAFRKFDYDIQITGEEIEIK
ncbi:MAG: hypothetical protein U9Q15_01125 [Patescibacteria group bacterium]|nr:hypothetical protein [Patescibacteria group bacterium]